MLNLVVLRIFMDKLYAPWRDRYVHQAVKGVCAGACVFCEIFNDDETDQQRFILWKNANIAVILNLYPYNGGHLLIIPNSHVEQLYSLSSQVQSDFIHCAAKSMKITQDVLGCDGINFGANFGKAAGAGIPAHLHGHIVPRFAGDTGFFTTIGNTKQISVDLENVYKKLKPYFDKNFNT